MSEDYSTTTPLVLDLQYHDIHGVWTQTIDARKLHEGLAIATPWTNWITRRIEEYEFVEDRDFFFLPKMEKSTGRPYHAYALTLDMAKELAMVERTPQGRQARQYFIACEKAAVHMYGTVAKMFEQFEERLRTLEGERATVKRPDQLTAKGQLPPPTPRIKEHAEVSWHLAQVWALLRDSKEVLTNHEISHRTGVSERTAKHHTRYLLQLGLLEMHEVFPRHLYHVAEQADKRNPGAYQRLQLVTRLIQERNRP